MKELYNNYKKEITKKNTILLLVLIIFLIGIIFGSIYITILSNNQKSDIMHNISLYFKNIDKISFDDKLDIFKNSLYSNLLYVVSIWSLGISVVGLPIIFIIIFFKSFTLGFSVSSIFAKYKLKGFLKAILYIFPSRIIFTIYIIFLASYSIIISIKVFKTAFKKETINFKMFMGRYVFLLVIGILISILCSLYDAFIDAIVLQLIK